MKQFAFFRLFLVGLMAISVAACTDTKATQILPTQGSGSQSSEPGAGSSADWNEATHGKDAQPNYSVVFPQDSVNRIDITLSPAAWSALHTELTEQFGAQGSGGQGLGNPGQMPAGQDFPNQQPPQGFPQGQQPPAGNLPNPLPTGQPDRPAPGGFQPGNLPRNGNPGGFSFGETSYVSSTVTFNGETWESVGFRYSGNSTLQTSWRTGTEKISFRLDFDEFEDVDPATTNQRFYGFKQISFKSNAMDDSYIREKVVSDIFRQAGVVSSQTAFYEVYVDYGEGPTYFGLYTAVEVVDDTVIETQFADGSGNVYKPDGTGAAFMNGTFNTESFEKQTNEDEADWSDIEAVFAALHSEQRTRDPASWRAGLEAVFDVEAFIRWLAVDTIIQNWDTYGSMAHNYYLYTDPTDGLVTWIPWDNNMALSATAMGRGGPGGGNGGGQGRGVRELDLASVGDQWPLIRYLMDDPVYRSMYQQYLEETIQGAFQPAALAVTYQGYHDLIAPYVARESEGYTQLDSLESFNQSVSELIQHANDRYDAVMAYLSGE